MLDVKQVGLKPEVA